MKRVISIQILRGVAAGMAVLPHTMPGHLREVGQAGVDVFFVISGFIIERASRGRAPAQFLKDRAIRVLPLWWIMAIPWVGIAAKLGQLTPQMLVATVTLWPVYDVLETPALRPGWSLQFEALFYLATAFGLAIPRLRSLLPAAWVACLVLALMTHALLFKFLGNPIILEFFAGILIARSSLRNRWLGAAAVIFAVATFGWFAANGAGGLPDHLWDFKLAEHARWLLWGAPAAAVVWGALQFEDVVQARAWAPFVFLGDASYSIYLSNFLIVLFLLPLLHGGWLLWGACLVGGTIVYRFVEQPLLRFLRGPRLQPVQAPQAV